MSRETEAPRLSDWGHVSDGFAIAVRCRASIFRADAVATGKRAEMISVVIRTFPIDTPLSSDRGRVCGDVGIIGAEGL